MVVILVGQIVQVGDYIMDNIFISRCGSQLGLEVLEDRTTGNAVVLWRDDKSTYVILMTNGEEIITSDPCFLPINNQGLGIGILDNKKASKPGMKSIPGCLN